MVGGWRPVPLFPEAPEGSGLEVLFAAHVTFGGSAFRLPIWAEGGSGLFESLLGGGEVAAFPGQVTAQEEAAGGLGIGAAGGGESLVRAGIVGAEEGDFAQQQEGAGLFGVDGVSLFEGGFGGGEIGLGLGGQGADDAPLLEGAVAVGVDALKL